MGTLLDDISLTHADDLVSADNRTESVSDHHNCLLLFLKQGIQGLLDLMLTVGIECAGSLIQ